MAGKMAGKENSDGLRKQLSSLLEGGSAHLKFGEVVDTFPLDSINERLSNIPYSPWQLLEHMRITQFDILDFVVNPRYKYMKWPEDYWPKRKRATEKQWNESLSMFRNDSMELQRIINSKDTDFYSRIPHGTGQTILREMLLVADHNAYHLGEMVVMQRLLGIRR